MLTVSIQYLPAESVSNPPCSHSAPQNTHLGAFPHSISKDIPNQKLTNFAELSPSTQPCCFPTSKKFKPSQMQRAGIQGCCSPALSKPQWLNIFREAIRAPRPTRHSLQLYITSSSACSLGFSLPSIFLCCCPVSSLEKQQSQPKAFHNF